MTDFKAFLNKLKNSVPVNLIKPVTAALAVVFGVVLTAFPSDSLVLLCLILGIIALVWGVITLVKYYRQKQSGIPSPLSLIGGIALLIAALMLILHPSFIISVLPFMAGLAIAASGAGSLINKKGGKVSAIIAVVIGAALILNPFKGAAVFVKLLGGCFIILGAVRLISYFAGRKNGAKPVPPDDDGYKEVDCKDI